MTNEKSKIVVLQEDVIGLHESIENNKKFDPDKTIYNLKTKSIRRGTAVILLRECRDSKSSLVMIDGDLYWIQTKSLTL